MKRLTFIFLFVLPFATIGQHLGVSTQYRWNRNVINPAFAGVEGFFTSSTWYRKQWVGIKGAPESFNVQVNGPLGSTRTGVGLVFQNDRTGVRERNYVSAQYAYYVPLKDGQLRFGLSGGIQNWTWNWQKVQTNEQDNVFASGKTNYIFPEVMGGIGYYSDRFEVGLSAPLIFSSQLLNQISGLQYQNFAMYSMYSVPMGSGWEFQPSVLLKVMSSSGVQADLMACIRQKDVLFFGVGLRTSDAVTMMAGVTIIDNLDIAYSYDILTALNKYASGSHELGIKYRFKYKVESVDPRLL